MRSVKVMAAVVVAVAGLLGAVAVGALDSSSRFLQRRDARLVLGGQYYRFVGVNAFSMATSWGENFGCGGPVDPESLFPALPDRAGVRIWAWQGSMATNPQTLARDWRPLDRIVTAAEQYGIVLIMNLASQAGDCDDGHWKDRAWYQNGYLDHYDEDGYSRTTTSYVDYVREIVGRYRNSPAVGMWELVNEPEASDCPPGYRSTDCYGHLVCPDENRAALVLRAFFDVVGRMVKGIDPNHLIGSGVIGGGQCGAVGENYRTLHASPYIDVASYHDYGAPNVAMPGDGANGLRTRIEQSRSLGKPLIVGESGIRAGDRVAACRSLAGRSEAFGRKIDAAFAAGAAGYLLWDAVATADPGCRFDLDVDDPVFDLLRSYDAR